jgi:hypothetical protein
MNGRDMEERSERGTADKRLTEEAFESLLERALRIDVPATPTAAAPIRRRPRRVVWGAMDAGILLALGVSLRILQNQGYISTGDLRRDIVAHIHHEPGAVSVPVVSERGAIATADVEAVLRAAGAGMAPLKPIVRYAKLCPFRGEMVAHFVVQGEQGPVTVLLLPNEKVNGPERVDEDGFVGTIVPLQIGGSIAVVGEPGETALEDIQREVAAAVQWRL